jgi:hypothetical protein
MSLHYEFEPFRADAAHYGKAGEEITIEADLYLREGLESVDTGTPYVATGQTITLTIARVAPPYSDTLVAEVLNAAGSVDVSVTNRVRCTVTLPSTMPAGDHLMEWRVGNSGDPVEKRRAFPAGNRVMRLIVGPSLCQLAAP